MFIVAALYHFTRFKDHRKLCGPLQNKCNSSGVTGSLLVAPEGINGTISGSRQGIDNVIKYIKTLPGCSNIEHKESVASFAAIPKDESKDKKRNCNNGST
jgi:Predicted sulfurtransferase